MTGSMYPELKGKVALVTGASRGFGRAVAQRLAKELANVVVNYRRSRAEANKVVEEIKARYPVEATAIRADVGSEKSLDSMFEQINKIFHITSIASLIISSVLIGSSYSR